MKLNKLIHKNNKSKLAVLVDPDKFNEKLIVFANKSKVAFFLVGGSRLKKNNIDLVILKIKKISKKPVILFPGDETQLSKHADGMLLLSLISGRNAEYLIGKHVKAVPGIIKMKIKTMATGYILIDGKKISSTQNISKTKPLSINSINTIVNTAIAGELMGLEAIYLEAGSGAGKAVNSKIISAVRKNIDVPLIVGGGINNYESVKKAMKAGANVIVVGNALEKNLYLLTEIEKAF